MNSSIAPFPASCLKAQELFAGHIQNKVTYVFWDAPMPTEGGVSNYFVTNTNPE